MSEATATTLVGVPRRWGDAVRVTIDVPAGPAFDQTRESDQCIDLRLRWPGACSMLFVAERASPLGVGDTLTITALVSIGVGSAAVHDMAIDVSTLGTPVTFIAPADSIVVAFRVRVQNAAPAAHTVVVRATAIAAPFTFIRPGDAL